MNNETGLDWLARNVHVWPDGMREVLVCYPRNVDTLIWSCVSSNAGWITKEQWLARRAELQSRPSFADHPDAKCLVQMSWGGWFKNKSDVTLERRGEKATLDSCGTFEFIRSGEVLGDWRDTLEKRPEEFQPFTSIEDNQEKAMEQDNGWHERGELPPVGVVCEAYIDYPPQWIEAEIVAHKDGFAIGWCKSVMKGCHGDKASEFRPIRTERDVLKDLLAQPGFATCVDVAADAILAAGFSRRDK